MCLLLSDLLYGFLWPPNVSANALLFRSELSYSTSDTKSENKTTGQTIRANFDRFDQLYDLDVTKEIYPYLTFGTGTLFELNRLETDTGNVQTITKERILRPYVRFDLSNPLHQAGVEYRRNQRDVDTTGVPDIEFVREEYLSFFSWRPEDLPRLDLRYIHIHTYDDPDTVDEIEKLFALETNYSPWEVLNLDYFYSRIDTDNRLENFDTLLQTHLGRIEYADRFFENRLSLSTTYRIRYSRLELPGTATQDIPLQRSQGLFSLDDTPQDGPALEVNSALIDGNLVASAGIDIGLGGDETTLTNIGVDFGFDLDVNEVRIWVDRNLTDAIANTFSWDVYTSPDNTDNSTWTFITTVFPADFGTFENRFEIAFPTVNTRFIKVVTTPLSSAVPGAANFPNIFVTEIQAIRTVIGAEVDNEIENLDQNYDLNLRARLSKKTVLSYNLNFVSREEDPSSFDRKQLSNELSLSHIFNNVFSARARGLRTDTDENNEHTTTYRYSTALRAAYIPTFDQTLTLSGTSVKEEEDSSDEFSVILRTNATLYRNWSMFVDTGYSWDRPLDSDDVEEDLLFRAGTNLQPNEKISIDMNYQARKRLEPEDTFRYEWDISAFYVPFTTLSLNASLRVVDRENQNRRTFQSYTMSWSPFRDGSLQLFFTWNETLTNVEDQKTRSIGPGLNWTISKHFFFEMFYNIVEQDSNTQKVDTDTLVANLRINF